MLQNFTIQGLHMEVDDNLRKYVNRKIGGIDKYIPRSARQSLRAAAIFFARSTSDVGEAPGIGRGDHARR